MIPGSLGSLQSFPESLTGVLQLEILLYVPPSAPLPPGTPKVWGSNQEVPSPPKRPSISVKDDRRGLCFYFYHWVWPSLRLAVNPVPSSSYPALGP